jgi:hypothetical protein
VEPGRSRARAAIEEERDGALRRIVDSFEEIGDGEDAGLGVPLPSLRIVSPATAR